MLVCSISQLLVCISSGTYALVIMRLQAIISPILREVASSSRGAGEEEDLLMLYRGAIKALVRPISREFARSSRSAGEEDSQGLSGVKTSADASTLRTC